MRLLALLLLACLALAATDYEVINEVKTTSSIKLELQYIGSQDYWGNPKSPISKRVHMMLRVLGFNDFDLKFYDPDHSRYEVPQTDIFPIDPLGNFTFPLAFSAIQVEYTFKPFDIKILRSQNLAVLLDLRKGLRLQ